MLRYPILSICFLCMLVYYMSPTVVAHANAAAVSQEDHLHCRARSYLTKSRRYQTCLQELQEYHNCQQRNAEKLAPYQQDHTDLCTKEAAEKFPDGLLENTSKHYVITYENEPDSRYHVMLKDEAQYTAEELANIKQEYVLLCVKEYATQHAALQKTLPDCKAGLKVAK